MKFFSICRAFFLLGILAAAHAHAQFDNECIANEQWLPVGDGTVGATVAFTEMNGDLYAIHEDSLPHWDAPMTLFKDFKLSRWDGSSWTLLSSFKVDGSWSRRSPFSVFAGYDGMLYLGGVFTEMNGDSELGAIAKWNGSAWVPARGSHDLSNIYSIHVHQGELYMSGIIKDKPYPGSRVLRWNGSDWSYVGGDVLARANTMTSWNGALYATGSLVDDGTSTILKWDGTAWSTIDSNIIGSFTDLAVYNNQLYVAGWSITTPTGKSHIARYNGTYWENNFPMPEREPGFYDAIMLAVHEGQLYATTGTTALAHTGDIDSRGINRFDGSVWREVSNTNGVILAMNSFNGSLVIGGAFSASCNTTLSNVARLQLNISGVDGGYVTGAVSISPNPARQTLRLDGAITPGSEVIMSDLMGAVISRYRYEGNNSMTMDVSALPAGVYLLQTRTANGTAVHRVSIVR